MTANHSLRSLIALHCCPNGFFSSLVLLLFFFCWFRCLFLSKADRNSHHFQKLYLGFNSAGVSILSKADRDSHYIREIYLGHRFKHARSKTCNRRLRHHGLFGPIAHHIPSILISRPATDVVDNFTIPVRSTINIKALSRLLYFKSPLS